MGLSVSWSCLMVTAIDDAMQREPQIGRNRKTVNVFLYQVGVVASRANGQDRPLAIYHSTGVSSAMYGSTRDRAHWDQ